MSRGLRTLAALTILGGLGAGGIALARVGDGPARPDGDPKPTAAPPAPPSLADRYRQIVREFEAQQKRAGEASKAAKDEDEGMKVYLKLAPDELAYMRRMLDLAEASPKDPTSRDALIWIIDKPYMTDSSVYTVPITRAVDLLIQHHADDPEVARAGLGMDNIVSRRRDAFLEGVYANAEGREARGLARMALGLYLESKAKYAAGTRQVKGRMTFQYQAKDDRGKPVMKTGRHTNEEEGYRAGLRLVDPDAVRREAERLYEEVIAEYGDVPFVTRRRRKLEALLRERPPATVADPEEKAEMLQVERLLARAPETLAQAAAARLDDLRNLKVGSPAPAIDGVGIDGKPLRLSDYRGKVVALVFWGSWCGPCMREVPHERELVERLKGRPFALLGVDCDEDKAAGLKAIETERMTWPHWNDGAPGEGPIVKRYHIRGYPSMVILDARGIIRYKDLAASSLDKTIDDLVKEAEAKAPGR